jgi:hypothetical protein
MKLVSDCLILFLQGCASWKWYFPYHYAPFASDFVNIAEVSTEFEKETKPVCMRHALWILSFDNLWILFWLITLTLDFTPW